MELAIIVIRTIMITLVNIMDNVVGLVAVSASFNTRYGLLSLSLSLFLEEEGGEEEEEGEREEEEEAKQ